MRRSGLSSRFLMVMSYPLKGKVPRAVSPWAGRVRVTEPSRRRVPEDRTQELGHIS